MNRVMGAINKESPDNGIPDKKTLLILDDEAPVRNLLDRFLKREGYECRQARDTNEARRLLLDDEFDLILCDINMPGESGLDFIKYTLEAYPAMAVIMITAVDDPDIASTALDMGVYGYIIKPFKTGEVSINISNVLRRRQLEIENRTYRNALEETVSERTLELKDALNRLQRVINGIINAMALTVETRDPYTGGHQRRVAELGRAIAVKLGISVEHADSIHMAGLIHDLGKIAVPAEILSKPGRLSSAEFELIKNHPGIGFDILKDIEFPWPIAKIIQQHHEREDGSGYPLGLKGPDILLESKILAVADVVEAMAAHRPYRPALGIEKALEEIADKKAVLYNPDVVEACLGLFRNDEFCF